jgi:RNA recognition motif. (a.k.a. RRM, RBD, or RNP domain)
MPVPEGNESQNNFVPTNSYLVRTSNKAPAANDIYVGLIPNDVDSHLLHTLFSRFGEIDRIYEGRRSSPQGGMKWAFISYIRAEDAYKYFTCERY